MTATATKTDKPARTLDYNAEYGLLTIKQTKGSKCRKRYYTCRRIDCKTPGMVRVMVEKTIVTLAEEGGEKLYMVDVIPATGGRRCVCRGFAKHGYCVHSDAVVALVARGHFSEVGQ